MLFSRYTETVTPTVTVMTENKDTISVDRWKLEWFEEVSAGSTFKLPPGLEVQGEAIEIRLRYLTLSTVACN